MVEDLAGKLEEIEQAGGRVLVRNLPFAGGGEVGLFADPDGNVLGLWKRKAGGPAETKAPAVAAKPATKPATAAKAPAAAPATSPASAAKPAAAAKPKKKK
jgi:hypothetical protein